MQSRVAASLAHQTPESLPEMQLALLEQAEESRMSPNRKPLMNLRIRGGRPKWHVRFEVNGKEEVTMWSMWNAPSDRDYYDEFAWAEDEANEREAAEAERAEAEEFYLESSSVPPSPSSPEEKTK